MCPWCYINIRSIKNQALNSTSANAGNVTKISDTIQNSQISNRKKTNRNIQILKELKFNE